MNYRIEAIPYFKKRAKRLIKKYPSLKPEPAELGRRLSSDPEQGTVSVKELRELLNLI